jgi:photosystem II stability/assembly factor-like uncharacterized protein
MKWTKALYTLSVSMLFAAAWMLLAVATGQAQQRTVKKIPQRAAATTASSAPEPKYKGIWEPVNYPDDIEIKSVFFVNENEGWAAGKGPGGFIVHTTDGGENWEIQLGELNSTDKYFDDLLFLDQKHGWAVQDKEKLVRTSDGIHWEDAGVFPQFLGLQKYTFTSPRNGIMLTSSWSNSQVQVTRDGGRNWKKVFQCQITLQIEGLTKKLDCHLFDMRFPSARVGYAAGGGFNGGYAVVAKTEDGGTTWKIIFATTEMETVESVFFTDENKGIIELKDHRVFATADGGQTWRGIPFSLTGPIRFSDPEVGVSCERTSCGFTADGGEHWLSRDFRFPAHVKSFSIPRRDRIYVAGDHGMVYRYRVVPADYMAKGSIDAPLLSSYGGAINSQLQQIRTEVQQLQTKIGSAPDSASSAPASTGRNNGSQPAATPAGQPRNQVGTAANQVGSAADGASASQDSSGDGGFSQDAANVPAGADSQSAGGEAGFSQDALSAPPSQPVQDCCGAQIQSLQTDLNSFSQQVPAFTGKYRNLNLLFVGLNMLNDLIGKARGMRDSFLALKKAPNLQVAAAALQDLAGKLDNTSQAISTGFQDLNAGGFSQGAGGAVGNMIGNAVSGEPVADPNAGPAEQNATQNTEQQKKEEKKKSDALDKLKKLKRKFPF